MFSPKPKAHATSIEEKAKQLRLSPEDLREWYKLQGVSEKELEKTFSPSMLQNIYSPPINKILPKAASVIGWDPQRLRREIKIDVINSLDIDCRTVPRTFFNRTIKLRIFAGLSFFVNKLTLAFVSEILKKEGEPELPDAIEEARFLLDAFHGKYPKQQAWSLTSMNLSRRQTLLHAVLLGTLHEAVIAHEFGHIIHFISGDNISVYRLMEQAARDYFGNSGYWDSQWISELVADILGAQLMKEPESKGEFTARHALIIFILIIDMIEKSGVVKPTHPSAEIRKGLLEELFPETKSNNMLENCEYVCKLIMESQ